MCRFPEVAAEIKSIEELLIQSAETEAIAPPADMQDRIWAAIQASGSADNSSSIAVEILPASAAEKQATKVISLQGSGAARSISWARAAIWLALAGSVVTNFMLWSGRSTDQRQVAGLQQQINNMDRQQQVLTAGIDRYKKEAEMAATPGMQPVAMLSTQPGHPCKSSRRRRKACNTSFGLSAAGSPSALVCWRMK